MVDKPLMQIQPMALSVCPNCAEPLLPRQDGSAPLHCPACGQETNIQAPKLGELLQQFGGAYLSTEGALWRTLKQMLFKPGALTVDYLAGRRRRYVLPLRLYLTISLLLLVVVRFSGGFEFIGGLQVPSLVSAEQKQGPLQTLTVTVLGSTVGLRSGVFVCQRLPGWLCQQLQARAATDGRTFLYRLRTANDRVTANFGVVMFVLLPVFAVCLMLATPGRGLRYTEHLVFALHLHSFWFIVLAVVRLLPWANAYWGGVVLMAAYTLLADGRVYGGPWWQRLLRALALTLMYAGMLAVAVPVAYLLAVLA